MIDKILIHLYQKFINMNKNSFIMASMGIIFMLVYGSLLFTGCAKDSASNAIVETNQYVMEVQHGETPFDEGFYWIDSDIEYPSKQGVLTDSIMLWIYDVVCRGSDYDEYLADASGIKSIEGLVATIKDACMGNQMCYEFEVKKVCESPLFVTFTSANGFSGGNSGYYLNQTASFRKSDGHKLSLSDLTDKSFNELKESIWKYYDSHGLGDEYSKSMKEEVNKFDIGLYKDKIIFSYPHTMHGAVMDPCDIAIPLSDAKKMFKKDFDLWDKNDEVVDYTKKETGAEANENSNDEAIIEFITDMYNNTKYEDDAFLEQHCSKQLLKKLQEEFDYDCFEGNCYASWLFRSGAQDGPNDRNEIVSVEALGDNWYIYNFYDMGNYASNKIKVVLQNGTFIIKDVQWQTFNFN